MEKNTSCYERSLNCRLSDNSPLRTRVKTSVIQEVNQSSTDFFNRNPQLENVNETLSWQRQEDIISYSLVDIYKFKKLMICSKKGSRMKEGIALVWKINT